MIDDFTDVNSGEKDFMKMWNLHIQHYTFVGDCQMPQVINASVDYNCHSDDFVGIPVDDSGNVP